MPDLVVRPSTKMIMIGYVIALVLVVLGEIAVYIYASAKYWWAGAVPGVGYLLILGYRHLALMTEKLTFNDDHLHHEIGFISKSTRTINLAKVQDVTVFQSVKQRMLGMGRISVETSGGSSAITIDNIDNPHKVAEMILTRSRQLPPLQHP
jgi:uncharacterized membrane protein YdbT with pleckstrin-like domain